VSRHPAIFAEEGTPESVARGARERFLQETLSGALVLAARAHQFGG
jgi:hypothetical protein